MRNIVRLQNLTSLLILFTVYSRTPNAGLGQNAFSLKKMRFKLFVTTGDAAVTRLGRFFPEHFPSVGAYPFAFFSNKACLLSMF